MAYLLSDGATTVLSYPYTLGELRRDNPSVSFPASPSNALLAEYNMFFVAEVPAPSFNFLEQDLNEDTPVTDDGGLSWAQNWVVTDVDAAVIASRTAGAEQSAQNQATRLLQDAEQYYFDAMVAGHGFTAEMSAYITALSDPSSLPNYPLVSAWPTLPVSVLDAANPDLPVDVYTREQTAAVVAAAIGDSEAVDFVAMFEDSLTA